MDENIAKVVDFFSGLVIEAGKNKIKALIDKNELKSALSSYLDRELEKNEYSDLNAEIDFQGLIDCVNDDLLEYAQKAIFEIDPVTKQRSREHIVAVAVDHTHAQNPEAKSRVMRIMSNCLDIVCDHYWRKIDNEDLLLAGKTVEVLDGRAETRHQEDQKRFDRLEEKLEEIGQNVLGNKPESISAKEIEALFVPGATEAIKPFLKKVLENKTRGGWHPNITIDNVSTSDVRNAVAKILVGSELLKEGWSPVGRNGIQGTFFYDKIEAYLLEYP